jgi:hypothetical protein
LARSFSLHFPLSIAAVGLAISLQATPAQAITTWDWSFTNLSGSRSGSGTFTTADVVPTANTTYDILGLSGTYSHSGTTYDILGLSSSAGADNTFRWDGTPSSSIISNGNGIVFTTSGGISVKIYSISGLGPINGTRSSLNGNLYILSGSTLQPQQPVPGPLPLFGAAAAYSWSRRLRRRIAEKV